MFFFKPEVNFDQQILIRKKQQPLVQKKGCDFHDFISSNNNDNNNKK